MFNLKKWGVTNEGNIQQKEVKGQNHIIIHLRCFGYATLSRDNSMLYHK